MLTIELSARCQQAGIGGDLLTPEKEEQQRSYANAARAFDNLRDLRQPLAHMEEEAFVLWSAHNAAVLNRRYVAYRITPDPIAVPKTGIASMGYNRLIIVERKAVEHLVLWPDYSIRSEHHSVLCLLKKAEATIRHLMVRGNGHHDTQLMDDLQCECHQFTNTIKRDQHIERREAAKRWRQRQ